MTEHNCEFKGNILDLIAGQARIETKLDAMAEQKKNNTNIAMGVCSLIGGIFGSLLTYFTK